MKNDKKIYLVEIWNESNNYDYYDDPQSPSVYPHETYEGALEHVVHYVHNNFGFPDDDDEISNSAYFDFLFGIQRYLDDEVPELAEGCSCSLKTSEGEKRLEFTFVMDDREMGYCLLEGYTVRVIIREEKLLA